MNHSTRGKECRAESRWQEAEMAKTKTEQLRVWLDDPVFGTLQPDYSR